MVEDPGRLIVLNKAADTAMILALPSGEVQATLKTGEGPHEVVVDPQGRYAVVSDYGRGRPPGKTLTVIDLRKLVIDRKIELGKPVAPHGLAFTPDGHGLWVTAENTRQVWKLSFPQGEVLGTANTRQLASHMVALGKDGRAYVANIGSGSVTRVAADASGPTESLTTGPGAEGIAMSHDGKYLWVSNREADTVSIVDTEKWEIAKSLSCAGFPIRVLMVMQGERELALVSSARSGEVYVFDSAAQKLLKKLSLSQKAADDGTGRLFQARFGKSPIPIGMTANANGKTAFVALAGADLVAVLDLVEMKFLDRAFNTGKEPDGIAWIPTAVP